MNDSTATESAPRAFDVEDFQAADEALDRRERIDAHRESISDSEGYRISEKRQRVREALMTRLAKKGEDLSGATIPEEVYSEAHELNRMISAGETDPDEIMPGVSEAVPVMAEFREKNTEEAIGEYERLGEIIEQCRGDLRELTLMVREKKRPPAMDEIYLATELRSEFEACTQTQAELERRNPESFYALNLKKLKGYSEQVRSGQRLVETEYVKRNLEDIIDDLGKGNITFLYGETGSGKTEIAHLAAQRFSGQRAELVRGYSGMGSEELFGHLALSAANSEKAKDVPDKIEAEHQEWLEEHEELRMSNKRELCHK